MFSTCWFPGDMPSGLRLGWKMTSLNLLVLPDLEPTLLMREGPELELMKYLLGHRAWWVCTAHQPLLWMGLGGGRV